MDKKIICFVSLFGLNQKIIYPDGREERGPSKNLSQYLVSSCKEENINKIHFFGNEKFLEGFIENIKNIEKFAYNQNNIEIEVN